jgi:plasmid stabilization system protein ParE
LSPAAEADLERLFDFLLERCETSEDLDCAQSAIDAIRAAAQNPAQRELIIPFGNTGYRSADFIGNRRVVFNIGGNHYRLIVNVAYRTIRLIDMDPGPNTPEGDHLELLGTLVVAWERRHFPIENPSAIEAIGGRMVQGCIDTKDVSLNSRSPSKR